MGQKECQSIKCLCICRPKTPLIQARWNLAGFCHGSFLSISLVWLTACAQKNRNAAILRIWSATPAINFLQACLSALRAYKTLLVLSNLLFPSNTSRQEERKHVTLGKEIRDGLWEVWCPCPFYVQLYFTSLNSFFANTQSLKIIEGTRCM